MLKVVTALFAVCGMNFWLFLLTLTLSLPRGLAGIYIGGTCGLWCTTFTAYTHLLCAVLALESAEGHPSKLNQILSNVILGITILITVIAMVYVITCVFHLLVEINLDVIPAGSTSG